MSSPPSHPPRYSRARSGAGKPGPRERKNDGEEYKGLCVNCAYRDTCLLPRSEGGVWHCEKYAEDDNAQGEVNGDELDRGMT
jgi:hypothetical protein